MNGLKYANGVGEFLVNAPEKACHNAEFDSDEIELVSLSLLA